LPKTRTKPVAFHVTPDEYEKLQAECAAGAARNPSELARVRLLRAVTGNSLSGVATRLDELKQAVDQLSQALKDNGVSHGRH